MADNPYSFSNLLTPFKPLFSGLVSPTIPTLPKPAAPSPSPAVTPASNMSIAPTPAVPNINYTPYTPAPTPAPAPAGGGSYTVASGDTLSAIAAQNKISLSELLNLNPQFRANPNLIKPGQTVTLKGASAPAQTFNIQPKPATPGTITTPSGAVVNPSTGGLVTPPPGSPAVPEVPEAATPPGPLANPLFTSPGYESAAKAYEGALPLTPEEVSNQEAINALDASIRTGITGEANRPIPLPFITGRQKAIEQRGLALEQPLQAKAALLQAKRTATLEASKFKLDQEAGKLGALREASKPVSVAPGTSLVNPLTGKTVASGGSLSDKQALDTFFNLTQMYPDAAVAWDDSLTPQQNLKNAQAAASKSPSFQAKNTVYAINPLTGEPTIISKMGGGGAFGGAASSGGGVTTNNLAPELKSALTSVSGVQFFDASKVTSAQLPYLQRAAQEMGLPLLSKEDANKVQESLQSFSSASALVQQIVNLTANVLTAPDNAGAQTVQAARLKAIELAPSLSTDNNAKQFISARNSVLSLLTRAAGEKGVLTNQDIERIAQALPSYSDSSTLAAQKAANFSSVLQSVLTGALNAYIGTTSGGSAAGTGGGAGNDPLGLF